MAGWLTFCSTIAEVVIPCSDRSSLVKGFQQEEIPHDVLVEKLKALFGGGNYKSMPDEICWFLGFEFAKWTAESTSSKYMWERMA